MKYGFTVNSLLVEICREKAGISEEEVLSVFFSQVESMSKTAKPERKSCSKTWLFPGTSVKYAIRLGLRFGTTDFNHCSIQPLSVVRRYRYDKLREIVDGFVSDAVENTILSS